MNNEITGALSDLRISTYEEGLARGIAIACEVFSACLFTRAITPSTTVAMELREQLKENMNVALTSYKSIIRGGIGDGQDESTPGNPSA